MYEMLRLPLVKLIAITLFVCFLISVGYLIQTSTHSAAASSLLISRDGELVRDIKAIFYLGGGGTEKPEYYPKNVNSKEILREQLIKHFQEPYGIPVLEPNDPRRKEFHVSDALYVRLSVNTKYLSGINMPVGAFTVRLSRFYYPCNEPKKCQSYTLSPDIRLKEPLGIFVIDEDEQEMRDAIANGLEKRFKLLQIAYEHTTEDFQKGIGEKYQ